MARFGRFERFEVKNETKDGGKIRPDDNKGKTKKEIDPELLEELGKVGFDDEEFEVEQKDVEIKIDEKGNPVIPDGWTFLAHGSSLDRWDSSLLGNDFVVGNGDVNGQSIKGRPLCCVERSVASFDYERSGSNTAKSYGGKEQSFEIRVLFYKNPRLGEGKAVRDKLSADEIKDVSKYYMYQDGRHPAVPAGTKLVFVKSGDFDEITNTNGNNILWYVPEQYLQQYLDDVQQTQDIDIDEPIISGDTEISIEDDEKKIPTITNADVEMELSEFYTDDITNDYLEAYLAEKISQIYRDRLGNAGIFNVKKFLDGKLNDFQGVESYRGIIEELESALEVAESVIDEPSPEELAEETPKQDSKPSFIDKIGDRLDTAISGMEDLESRMTARIDGMVAKTEQFAKASFDQLLISAGFDPNCVQGIKATIKTVNPRKLVAMDSVLSNTKEQTLTRGGIEDGNEQSAR